MISKISASLKDICTFMVLMLIFTIIFIILGLQFFAYQVYLDSNGALVDRTMGSPPVNNFDTFLDAFITVFSVIIGNNWNSIMYSYLL